MDDSAVLSDDRTARVHSGTILRRRKLVLMDDKTSLTDDRASLSDDRTVLSDDGILRMHDKMSLTDDRTILRQRGMIPSNDRTILPDDRTLRMDDRLSLTDDRTVLHPWKTGKIVPPGAESSVLAQNDRFSGEFSSGAHFTTNRGQAVSKENFAARPLTPDL